MRLHHENAFTACNASINEGDRSMWIGAHVSTRGSYLTAAQAALGAKARAFQYFPKNPRSLVPKRVWNRVDAEACAVCCREHGLVSIGHSPYPLNLAVENDHREPMLSALTNALEITEACGSIGLVVHFGKSKGNDPLQGYKNIIQLINEALEHWQGKALILLENQAGEGTAMGTTFEELVQVRALSDCADKIGFCLDTCHAFASGLWKDADWQRFEELGWQTGYFDHLKAVHLNDSKYPSGSRRDRHANIGQGHIGLEPFRELLQSSVMQNVPIVMETEPGEDGTHRKEIELVQSLAH
jgi:deoxyribonuclease-4